MFETIESERVPESLKDLQLLCTNCIDKKSQVWSKQIIKDIFKNNDLSPYDPAIKAFLQNTMHKVTETFINELLKCQD